MAALSELLLGSSSSSSTTHEHNHRYDVFISFRGADTRNGFTDHLYNEFLEAGFKTFLDEDEIETGEPLRPELESAIKSSRASIIVLSKNYASSTWCLDELVLILVQKRNFNQIVIPIFFKVEPTDVRNQQSSFGLAMAKHIQRMEAETNAEKRMEWGRKIELWTKALKKVANLKGKDTKDRRERLLIDEVIADIHQKLGAPIGGTLPLLTGMKHKIEFISSWLSDGSCHTVDILTIVGISGIGKTSLAKYVFRMHSSNFLKRSFLEGINKTCNELYNGLLHLQMELHKDISKKNKLQFNDVSIYTSMIEGALACKKVFIVLDDIGSLEHLDALLGKKGLYPGSKIIITTKDASLTERCALFTSQVQPKHSKVILERLSKTESLELLCLHAFKIQNPKEGYKKVCDKLVKYCDGHPKAIRVLGKSLHKRDVAYWKQCIKQLKKEPHSHRINMILHMSFEPPLKDNKNLFEPIACFICGK